MWELGNPGKPESWRGGGFGQSFRDPAEKEKRTQRLLAGSCSSPALSEGFGLSAFLHPPLLSSSLLGSSAGKGRSARFLIFFSAWP